MKLAWLLRSPRWRALNLDCCRECGRRFARSEPGSWTDIRAYEFPELCRCGPSPTSRLEHVNCRACGPYCPACAATVASRVKEARDRDRDWR